MIYNNGTISVHKNHIGNLLFAVVRSGLVERAHSDCYDEQRDNISVWKLDGNS